MQRGIRRSRPLKCRGIVVGGLLLIDNASNQLLVIDYAGDDGNAGERWRCWWGSTVAIAISTSVVITVAVSRIIPVSIPVPGIITTTTTTTTTATARREGNSARRRHAA